MKRLSHLPVTEPPRITGPLPSLGLALFLFLLTAFAIWAGLTTQRATTSVRGAVHLSQLYDQARYAIVTEQALANRYRLEPGPELLTQYRTASLSLILALQAVHRDGYAPDRALASAILASHERYVDATYVMFDLTDSGDRARIHDIERSVVDPAFNTMDRQVYRAANAHRARAASSLMELAQTQGLIVVIMSVIFALAVLLSTLWMLLRRYQQRLDAATRVQVAQLERAALTDNLTALGNHRAFQEEYHRAVAHARTHSEALVLARIDIDEFKVINDQQGHLHGDRVLAALGTHLASVGSAGRAFRLGGDEFTILLPGMGRTEALAALERLRQGAAPRLFAATVSIGVALLRPQERDADTLHEEADAALYEAKRRGRNTIVIFDEIEDTVSILSGTKVAALRCLLAERRIGVVFQPIWDLGHGGIVAFEALTRPDAVYGLAGPQEAFDIAERIGRAHELDAICREAILAQATDLPPTALLFLNVSPQSLDHDMLAGSALVGAVRAVGLTPERVVLEITERSVARLAGVVREATRLRRLGFKLALDDAGAGNAGLEMLSQMPVDIVKIDRAVVANALTDQTADAVLAAIVAFAHKAQSQVVAEGIETAAMLDYVREAGAHYAQGYLLGRPSQSIPAMIVVPEALVQSADSAIDRERRLA